MRALLDGAESVRTDPLARIVDALGLDARPRSCLVAAAWWAEADPQLAVAARLRPRRRARDATPRRRSLRLDARAVRDRRSRRRSTSTGRSSARRARARRRVRPDALRLTPTAQLVLARRRRSPRSPRGRARRGSSRLAPRSPRHLRGRPARGRRAPRPAGRRARRALACAAARGAGLVPVGPSATGRRAAPARAASASASPVVPARRRRELGWSAADGPLVVWRRTGGRAVAGRGYVVDLGPPTRDERSRDGPARSRRPASRVDDAARSQPSPHASRSPRATSRVGARARAARRRLARPPARRATWSGTPRDASPSTRSSGSPRSSRPAFTLDDLVLADDVAREAARARRARRRSSTSCSTTGASGGGFRAGRAWPRSSPARPERARRWRPRRSPATLRQDLYRIDLSAVVSKYIGETEKNLAAAFDEAERASAVLFFDEADALFGKRTEVRDAHDRYANLEVNYLLQRVETFTGLVILATNRQAALDEAFLRRLRFVIRFELPDRALRRATLAALVPARRPSSATLDWEALADGGAHRRAASRARRSRRRTSRRPTAAWSTPGTSSTRCGASTRSWGRRGPG